MLKIIQSKKNLHQTFPPSVTLIFVLILQPSEGAYYFFLEIAVLLAFSQQYPGLQYPSVATYNQHRTSVYFFKIPSIFTVMLFKNCTFVVCFIHIATSTATLISTIMLVLVSAFWLLSTRGLCLRKTIEVNFLFFFY